MRMKGDTDCIIRHLGHHTTKTFRSLQVATGWSRFPEDAIVNGLKTKMVQVPPPELSPTPQDAEALSHPRLRGTYSAVY